MNFPIYIMTDPGTVSDGYHTFDELYHHRNTLFLALMAMNLPKSWRSIHHSDGKRLNGWFIAGMEIGGKQVTYHMPTEPYWSYMDIVGVNTLETAPEWDGHTSQDVLKRVREWLNIA